MHRRITRSLLLTLAFTLAILTWEPRNASAACVNGSTQWVGAGGCCYSAGGYTRKWKYQSCIYGSWVDNGGVKCSGACPIL